jgi:hypothetical protein
MADRLHTTGAAVARRRRFTRSAVTNNPLSRGSGHTASGRRIRDLYQAYASGIGADDVAGQAAALAMAELRVAPENCRSVVLANAVDATLIAACARLEGAADRAERKLGKLVVVPRHVPLRERFGT